MRIAFAGFRHGHIFSVYKEAVKNDEVVITGCYEEDTQIRKEVEEKYGAHFVYDRYEDILQDDYEDDARKAEKSCKQRGKRTDYNGKAYKISEKIYCRQDETAKDSAEQQLEQASDGFYENPADNENQYKTCGICQYGHCVIKHFFSSCVQNIYYYIHRLSFL